MIFPVYFSLLFKKALSNREIGSVLLKRTKKKNDKFVNLISDIVSSLLQRYPNAIVT